MSAITSPVTASPVMAEASVEVTSTAAQCFHHVEPFGEGFCVVVESPYLRVGLLTLGASLNSVQVRNPHVPDEYVEVCLGFTDAEECVQPGAVIGATCGRFAGRIGEGEFDLNGTNYKLLQNYGGHTLHGGPGGFGKKQWKYLISDGEDEIGVAFHLASPHLDQGFPGELFVTATYSISKHAPLIKIEHIAALSDSTPVAATIVNLTNHAYWNLNGVPRPGSPAESVPLPVPVHNHYLQLKAKYFVDTSNQLIPGGEMVDTEGTAHNYSELRCIAAGMEATAEQGRDPSGYDDPVALETWDCTLREAAVMYSPATKLQMRVCTTCPAVVVYTANHLPDVTNGSKGQRFQRHSGICLQCQYFPNSPNVPTFPSTTLNKGETYSEVTTHEFKFLAASPI